ncbi:hypothetical protein HMPREF1624_06230 [Sporothrix schenckii ATCC 58251]|uniref:Beta-mannosidase B n=1 Tax=Sporothrix schenckii (strain ATCC 58251 / de Perez 2211183) TaxID=1391915 RepID=U7PQB9_SPOS1|nr:hypothetical protein HMPREF1624_06230 [Sporothrix schenckii ATCC 58251]
MAVIAIHQAEQGQRHVPKTLSGWKWRQLDKQQEWTACAHDKPITEIFTDLIDAGRIPDPFLDENEKLVQWVGEADWEYECSFKAVARSARQVLVFDGLDTFAAVYLNDQLILESDNMFHTHRVDVHGTLRDGANSLLIVFRSALNQGKAIEAKLGKLTCFNGDSSRVYVRKAQYHYGWDWGPTFLTCGPYREIRLETYDAAVLYDVFANAVVSDDLQQAKLDITFAADVPKSVIVQATVTSPSGKTVPLATSLVAGATNGSVSTTIAQPELWYPINHGPQAFYTVKLEVYAAGNDTATSPTVLATSRTRIGIRRARLVQEPLLDAPGTSFYFEVNNEAVYVSGSNWIPRHSFLTALTDADYRQSVDECVASNQNMLRVWGGGLYEHDAFYDQCDERGVLVWQDFMFACGQYPCHDTFEASVRREAEDQVRRMRRFCSIVLYAGNNEDYQVAEQIGLDWDQDDNSGNWTTTNFPARYLYERTLPAVVAALNAQVPYHPGSPWGGINTEDATMGDIHMWHVWHGTQEPYQNWPKLTGRFVSEFGMLAFPARRSVERYVTDPAQRYPQSSVLDLHNKAGGGERRLGSYILENLRLKSVDIDAWIYASQLVQAECLASAIRSCRRQWKGRRREYCGGQLVWQINDCWPVSSWALIDFYGERKLAFYAVKRHSAPLVVDLGRTYVSVEEGKNTLEALKPRRAHIDVWAANASLSQYVSDVTVTMFDIVSGTVVSTRKLKSESLAANETTELLHGLAVDDKTAVQAVVRDASTGAVLSRASDWPQPLKHVALATSQDSGVQVTVLDNRVEITSKVPIKGLELSLSADKAVTWSDNGVDVFPGDVYSIDAPGLSRTDTVDVRYYGLH